MFLTGPDDQVLRLYTDPDAFPPAQAHGWMRLLQRRHQRLLAGGTAYYHLIVPDKISAVSPEFGTTLDYFEWHPAAQLARLAHAYGLDGRVIDCTRAMRQSTGRFPAFYRTASHWTVWGAYIAYCCVCHELGVQAAGFDHREFSLVPSTFDLGGMMAPPHMEDCIFTPLDPAVTRISANGVVEALERGAAFGQRPDGARAVFANSSSAAVPKTIMIFGDGCADYRPSTLTAFLAETFAQTHFTWSTSLDYAYIDRVKPDIVLTEIMERSLLDTPDGE